VPDKNIILNMHSFTNETVTGYLAVLSDERPFLYLYKCSYFRTIVNTAAICIDEIEYPDIFANLYVIETLLI
jgi:hypothetical protein